MSALPAPDAPAPRRGAGEPAPRRSPGAGGRPSRPVRHLPPPATRRARSRVGLLVALVVVGLVAVVAVQARSAQQAFAARALEQEVAELEAAHQRLTSEVATLSAPARLERIATDDLGMVEPDEQVWVDLSAPGRLATDVTRPLTDVTKQAGSQ